MTAKSFINRFPLRKLNRKRDLKRSGQWVSPGIWEFAAGPHRVQIHNSGSAQGDWVVGDAVSFVRVE